ncbi:MAG TPA: methyltransferase domain-containing protein [Verrucomicrobiae bacterium]|nr:methyltransferase domain-containing protein [Verrucomicrobiae bacterium]
MSAPGLPSSPALPHRSQEWIARSRAKKIEPYLPSNGIVFEYGAVNYLNLAGIRTAKSFATIFETSILPSNDICEQVAGTKEIKDASIDLVICDHRLEYETNPPAVLAEFQRMLKGKGTLLISAIYDPEYKRAIGSPGIEQLARYASPGKSRPHLYSWNVQSLGNLLTDCEFNLISGQVKRCPKEQIAAQQAVRFGLRELGFHLFSFTGQFLNPFYEVRIAARR